jgi:hypothetical protein
MSLAQLIDEHTLDPELTGYCTKCGRSERHIKRWHLPCVKEDNVIGISHRIAQKLRIEAYLDHAESKDEKGD